MLFFKADTGGGWRKSWDLSGVAGIWAVCASGFAGQRNGQRIRLNYATDLPLAAGAGPRLRGPRLGDM
jgi:hypothetical protein